MNPNKPKQISPPQLRLIDDVIYTRWEELDVFHSLHTHHHTFDLKAWIETHSMITLDSAVCISLFYFSALLRTQMWLVDVPLAQNDPFFKVSKNYCLRDLRGFVLLQCANSVHLCNTQERISV